MKMKVYVFLGHSGNTFMIEKRSISLAKLIAKRMGGRLLAFYIRGSRIFIWEGEQSSVLTLFVDILSPQYIVQRGALF